MDFLARLPNGLLMLALPLGLGIFMTRRAGGRWELYGAGGLAIVASQVLHLPFNGLILNPQLEALGFGERGMTGTLVLSAALLGLSSGIFEEGARYLVLRFWQREARSWRAALMFGARHGGFEAIIVGILVLVGPRRARSSRGKLERFPHCGKWTMARRAAATMLQAAEGRYLLESRPQVVDGQDTLRRLIDDSRFES